MSPTRLSTLPPLPFLDEVRAVGRQDPELLTRRAIEMHRMGRLGAARIMCHQALKVTPDSLALLEIGGVLGLQLGTLGEAQACLERARVIAPDRTSVRRLLGRVYRSNGLLEEALAEFRAVLETAPQDHDALEKVAQLLETLDRQEEALETLIHLAAAHPNDAEAYRRIADICRQLGRGEQHLAAVRERARLAPDSPLAQREILQTLVGLHRYDEVREIGAAAKQKGALDWGGLMAMGDAEAALLCPDAARALYEEAVAQSDEERSALWKLATFCLKNLIDRKAEEVFRRLLELFPDDYPALANLGLVLHRTHKLDEAESVFRQAVAMDPGDDVTWNNLASLLTHTNRPLEAMDAYEKALTANPAYSDAMSNMVFHSNYVTEYTPRYLFQLHRQWGERYAPASASAGVTHDNTPDPERPLRIGYVSADFCGHVVSHFTEKPLRYHDRGAYPVYCYANVPRPDAKTEQLKGLASYWRSIVGLSDDEIAAMIRDDGIDILVDLTGHTAGHRLKMFAKKPAPVQATWIGYPNTTGVPAIDYRITDAVADPPGVADATHSETLVRLPGGFLCYTPSGHAPEVAPLPAAEAGHVTFGCFNNLAKQMPACVALWCEILKRVPGSRIVLKAGGLNSSVSRAEFMARFERGGIDPSRVTLERPHKTPRDHLQFYGSIDIALDPFPYNGTTTTFEALWQGVPVVCLAGDRHAGRVGASICSHVGLPELVGADEAEYAEIAVNLATDLRRLQALRNGMRDRMSASPMMDGDSFTRTLEAAYRTMWRTWCQDKAGA